MADPSSATSPRHALIIEDELIVGMGMQSVLGEIGFGSFAFASTAHQALEQARLRRPDLVTADIGLLDGDGLAACRALQAEFGPLPIIYVTGQTADLQPGLTVVAKPFTAADIASAYAAVSAGAGGFGHVAHRPSSNCDRRDILHRPVAPGLCAGGEQP